MAEERLPSKFAFILHADVAGSTTLVQQDEELAHKRIQATFRRFGDIITHYHGQVRELRGDALLAEFERASDAVTAALVFLAGQSDYLAQLDDSILPAVRVGIAMGEVISADDTLTGAGVVLAQRVEQLAEPGGVCITGAIQEALPPRLPFDQDDLGEQQVKGFDNPVRVYTVGLKEGVDLPEPTVVSEPRRSTVAQLAIVAAVVVLICGGALLAWHQPWAPDFEPALVENMAFPLPKEPSIAVLPFDNYSDEETLDFFADGLTENITSALSKAPGLFVIARNSAATYKGKPVNVKQVAEELGVQYVLEGSVQKSGDQLRITARLVDAIKGHHLWTDRFDRQADDVFAVQDEITKRVFTELQVELTEGEHARMAAGGTDNLDAWLLRIEAYSEYIRFARESQIRARELYQAAHEADPNWAFPVAGVAFTHWYEARRDWSDSRDESIRLGIEFAERAIELQPDEPIGYMALGNLMFLADEPEKGIELRRKAVELAPNSFAAVGGFAIRLSELGKEQEAVELFEHAIRLSPKHPWWVEFGFGLALHLVGRKEEAVETYKRGFNTGTGGANAPLHARLAAVYADLGRVDEAKAVINEVLRFNPKFTATMYQESYPFPTIERNNWYKDLLVQSGLPEHPPLKLPDKPSIAVLPFANMSDDPQQKYFVDGMTEDLITDLSKIAGLFVIARNSSFTFKDKTVDVKDVARELGVRYVLEGSVRRAGDQVRINTQLIDATTGGHLWAERYDGTLEDIFTLQDKVTRKIIAALSVSLSGEEQASQAHSETDTPQAYDAFLQGWEHYRRGTPDDLKKSIAYLEQATKLDPYYSRAYAALAAVYWRIYSNRWYEQVLGVGYSFPAMEKAREYLQEAKISPTPLAHQVAAEISAHLDAGSEQIVAPTQAKLAIALDPNDPTGHLAMAMALLKYDRAGEAEQRVRQAMRLDPIYPTSYLVLLAWTEFAMGRYSDAAATLEQAVGRDAGNHRTYIYLAASYGQLGRLADAKIVLDKANELRAQAGWNAYSLSSVDELLWIGDSTLFTEGLRKAGVTPSRDDWSRLIKTVSTEGASTIEVEGATSIDIEEAKTLFDRNVPFIDVSKPWYQEHIPGSHFLMIWFTGGDTEFNEVRLARIAERDQPLVIYSSGLERRAANACAMAVTWGFQHVYYFENGLQEWKSAGYTLAKGY